MLETKFSWLRWGACLVLGAVALPGLAIPAAFVVLFLAPLLVIAAPFVTCALLARA